MQTTRCGRLGCRLSTGNTKNINPCVVFVVAAAAAALCSEQGSRFCLLVPVARVPVVIGQKMKVDSGFNAVAATHGAALGSQLACICSSSQTAATLQAGAFQVG